MDFLPDGNSDAAQNTLLRSTLLRSTLEQIEGSAPHTVDDMRKRLQQVMSSEADTYSMFYKGLAALEWLKNSQGVDHYPEPTSSEANDFYTAVGMALKSKLHQTELDSIIGTWLMNEVLPTARQQDLIDR